MLLECIEALTESPEFSMNSKNQDLPFSCILSCVCTGSNKSRKLAHEIGAFHRAKTGLHNSLMYFKKPTWTKSSLIDDICNFIFKTRS